MFIMCSHRQPRPFLFIHQHVKNTNKTNTMYICTAELTKANMLLKDKEVCKETAKEAHVCQLQGLLRLYINNLEAMDHMSLTVLLYLFTYISEV